MIKHCQTLQPRVIMAHNHKEANTMPTKRTASDMKYDNTHTRKYYLKLNIRTDESIIAMLDKQPNVQAYIKSLIRADIAAHNSADNDDHDPQPTAAPDHLADPGKIPVNFTLGEFDAFTHSGGNFLISADRRIRASVELPSKRQVSEQYGYLNMVKAIKATGISLDNYAFYYDELGKFPNDAFCDCTVHLEIELDDDDFFSGYAYFAKGHMTLKRDNY